MKKTLRSLLSAVLALVMCMSAFVGTTFAWFTDSVSSMNNIIKAGNLNIEMYWTEDLSTNSWVNVEDDGAEPLFNYDNWEPGYTQVRYVRIVNAGSLAFKYMMNIIPTGEVGILADVIDVSYDIVTDNTEFKAPKAEDKAGSLRKVGSLRDVIDKNGIVAQGVLLPDGEDKAGYYDGEVVVCVSLHMQEKAGNEYQNKSVGDAFDVQLIATQFDYENDSFGNGYDTEAEWPENPINKGTVSASADVEVDANGVMTKDVTLQSEDGSVVVEVPAGTKLKPGVDKITMTVTPKEESEANIVIKKDTEVIKSYDIHLEGVAEDNQIPAKTYLPEFMPAGLNNGNYSLYHVEGGNTNAMNEDDVDHNGFIYEPEDGDLYLYLKGYSEVAVVADTSAAWEGKIATSFASGSGTEEDPYIIANADQLAGFGAMVGGMNGNTRKTFENEFVKLVADVNLGYGEGETYHIFYPIGYYFTLDKNGDGTEDDVYSTVYSFAGTFDGNGHTIANFYQNTWEMKGDDPYYKDNHYYNDAMGLFGYVYNGTVKNLTVDNFSSDGEFTPTGVIAAYADGNSTFENIAITNCNPRVYNTGNGGIIGIAGDTSAANDDHITLSNITVDKTNVISALWGSWDVACGGLVGMYRGNVDGSGIATGDTISFTNCHVAAQIDVYNDVCANYQYYAYRYAGMIIGSVRHNTKNNEGKTIPNMAGISASGCTVNYGDWNDYYYCEFEKNSMASYSEDYQFSRVDKSEIVFDENGNITGCTHTHTDEEDKTAVYLPFHQLFTGYSWGVSSIGLEKYSGVVTNLDIIEGDQNESVPKFESKFTGDFLYRVGNQNTVNLGSLFAAKNGVTINSSGVWVTIDKVDEDMNVSGTFTANTSDWTKGTIKFSGTGVVKVTIQDYTYCTPTELYLEVVDATNLTSAKGTTSGGTFVLLSDVNASEYVYYWNATLYGNGFTYSLNGAPTAYSSSHGHGVIVTKNATLDNLKIVGDVYDEYGAYTTNNDYNAAIDVMGDTVIQNCYISGCSAPISTRANATITNTTLYGGAVANLLIKGGTVTLENVTTANYNDGRNAPIGMGIVIHSDAAENTKLILNGTLKQYNFLNEEDTPTDTYAKNLHSAMFGSTLSSYHFETRPNRRVNTGVVSLTATFNMEDITDNANTGYKGTSVTLSNVNGYVYTQLNTSGSVNNDYTTEDYKATTQGAVPPSYNFDYTTKNYVAKTDGSNDYCYAENGIVNISMDAGDTFNWDTSILTVTKGNQALDYTVSVNGTDYTGKTIAFDTTDNYTVTYTYTDTNNYKLDENGDIVSYFETYTKTVYISVSVIEATAKNAEFTMGSSNAATEKITIDNTTYISATGVTADNSTWTYITINGQKIYYPIVAAKLTATKGSSSYAYFPVFENVVTITDYADNGTGDAFTYNSSTTTLPSTLTAVKGVYKAASDVPYWYNLTNSNLTQNGANKIFKWASSSDAPSDPTIYNNVLCYKSPQISANRVAYITLVQYSYTDATNTTYYYYVGYTLEAFTKQTTCVTSDTLVTLADGSKAEIQNVRVGDEVLAWNFYTGAYEIVPVSLLQAHSTGVQNVLHLYFEDGTELKILGEHGVFDADLNTFVFIDEYDVENYVGHNFVKQNGDEFTTVKLIDYEVTTEYTTAYTILSYGNYNVVLEDMLTVTPAHVGDNFFNPFDIGEDMKYEGIEEDIEKYGLYTYEDFSEYVTYEQFEALKLDHFKVSVGKGLITYEGLIYLIENFVNNEDFNV